MSLLPSVEDSLPGFASRKSLQRDRDEAACALPLRGSVKCVSACENTDPAQPGPWCPIHHSPAQP